MRERLGLPGKCGPELNEQAVRKYQPYFIWASLLAVVVLAPFAVQDGATQQTNQVIKESKEFRAGLLSAALEQEIPTYQTNYLGVITNSNMAGVRTLGGVNMEDILGHNISEWMLPDDAARHEGYLRAAKDEERKVDKDFRCVLVVHGEIIPKDVHVKSYVLKKRLYIVQMTDPEEDLKL